MNMDTPPKAPGNRIAAICARPDRLTALAILAATVLLLVTRPLQDQDIFFHLAAGRAIVDGGRLPTFDPFIFPLADAPTIHPEWGFEVIFHGTERLFGLPGVLVLAAFVGGLTVVMLYRIAARWAPPAVALAVATSAAAILEWRSVPRPEIILMLALVGFVLLAPLRDGDDRRRWWGLVPVAWALAMCHPSVVLLLGVAGALALEQAARARSAYPLAVVAVAALAGCLNPYGIDQVLLPYKFMGDHQLIDDLSEFLPALDTEYGYLFIAAIAANLAAILFAGRRTSWGMAIVFAIFAVAAYRHARLIPLLAVPMSVLLPLAWSAAHGWRRQALVGVLGALSILAAVVFGTGPRGIGFDERGLPQHAASRIATLPAGTRIANFLDFGGYLEWRLGTAYPLLVDGRNFYANRAVLLHDFVFRADPGWEQFLEDNRVDVVVMPPYMGVSGLPVPLFFRLINHPEWIMTDTELAGVTFVRRTAAAPGTPAASIAGAWKSALWILDETLAVNPNNRQAVAARDTVIAYLAGSN